MSSDWFKGSWGDLVELKYGKGLKNYKESDEDIPVFGTNGPVGFTSKALCNFPSIVIGRKGAYRGVHFSDVPFWVIDTAYFVVPKKDFNIKWAYYHLLTQDINALDSGSAIPSTSRDDFYQLPVNMPPRWQQDEIVSHLDALNQKIKINRESNQTLEQMAQAIFKSWFVDFDPVKAKMNGEQPEGMDAATASLFPEKLVESELGLIPEGWGVKSVGEFTTTFDYVANGSFAALKANVELFDESNDVLYVRTTDFNKGFKNDLKYTNESSYQFLSKSKLYGHETIISNVGDVGTVFRAPSWYEMPMTLGSNAMGIVADGANSYIYYLFKSHVGQHLLDGITSGSAQMKFNKTSFRKLRVVLPSNELLARFEVIEASLWAKHVSNQKESLYLEKLRDTLLPKLLSGEIELKESAAVDENDVVNLLLKQMDFGVKSKPRKSSIPNGHIGYITTSGTFGSDGGTFVDIPKAVQALTKITSADGTYGEIAGNALTENVLSGTVELATNNIIPLGVLTKICTAVFGKKTPIKPRNAVLLTSIHQAKNKTLDSIMNEQAKRFKFLEQSSMDEQEFGESLRYLESIGVVKCEGQHITLLDTIVQH